MKENLMRRKKLSFQSSSVASIIIIAEKFYMKFLKNIRTSFIIDAANEFSTGEVVVGIKNNQAVIAPDRAFYFPEVLEDSKSVLEMSCTELNNVKPQHLVTNLFAANICLIQTIKILSGDWTCGGIYSFDAFGCSCTRTDPNLIKQQQKGKLK